MTLDLSNTAAIIQEAQRRMERRAQGLPLVEVVPAIVPPSKRAWPLAVTGRGTLVLPRPTSQARETPEQREIVKVFQRFGCRCESTSQTRRSRVALGIPDLWVWLLPMGRAGWWESKSGEDWKFSRPQLEWAERCLTTVTPYGCGDRFAADVFCRALGLREL